VKIKKANQGQKKKPRQGIDFETLQGGTEEATNEQPVIVPALSVTRASKENPKPRLRFCVFCTALARAEPRQISACPSTSPPCACGGGGESWLRRRLEPLGALRAVSAAEIALRGAVALLRDYG